MTLAIKPGNIGTYFGSIVHFVQSIWITTLSKHIVLMLIKGIKFIINNTLVIVFNVILPKKGETIFFAFFLFVCLFVCFFFY